MKQLLVSQNSVSHCRNTMQYLLLFIISIHFTTSLQGQVLNSINNALPTAPNIAGQQQYGDIPVNLHNGLVSTSIPIGAVSEGGITVPANLSYHSSGIQVNQNASNVGLGWHLQAGGTISREIRNKQDEGSANQWLGYGWFEAIQNGNNPLIDASVIDNQLFQSLANGIMDTEPDIFHFNMNGYTGKFFFDENGIPILMNSQDIKIQFNYNISTLKFEDWVITTPDGTKYYFGQNNAVDESASYTQVKNQSAVVTTADIYTSAWHLTKIEPFNSDNVISFAYRTELYKIKSLSDEISLSNELPSTCPSNSNASLNCGYSKWVVSEVRTKVLTRVSSSTSAISFWQGTTRTDLDKSSFMVTGLGNNASYNPKTIGQIKVESKINNNTNTLRLYELNYDYFTNSTIVGTNTNDHETSAYNQRLRLLSIDVYDSDLSTKTKLEEWSFEYYDKDFSSIAANVELPNKLSNAVDMWGYYNGDHSNQNLSDKTLNTVSPYNLNGGHKASIFPEMQYGVLTKVNYPTGGFTTYEYEPHEINETVQYCDGISTKLGNGIVQKTTPSNVATSTSIQQFSFLNTEINNASISIQLQDNISTYRTFEGEKLYNLTLTVKKVGVSGSAKSFSVTGLNLVSTQLCHLGVTEANVNYEFKFVSSTNATFQLKYTPCNSSNRLIGGLRIKETRTSDGDSDNSNEIITNYEYTLDDGSPSGVLVQEPIIIQDLEANVSDATVCVNHFSIKSPNSFKYYLANLLSTPMSSTYGNHFGYKQVKVYQTGNGYTKHEFFIEPIHHTGVPTFPATFDDFISSSNIAEEQYRKGLLLSQSVYDETGVLVHFQQNTYNVTTNLEVSPQRARYFETDNGSIIPFTKLKTYKLFSGKIELLSSSTTAYGITNTTSYAYDVTGVHHNPIRTETVNSDGTIHTSEIKYVQDYIVDLESIAPSVNKSNDILAMEALINNHIFTPIETRQYINKGNGDKLVGAKLSLYKQIGSQILPKITRVTERNDVNSSHQNAYINTSTGEFEYNDYKYRGSIDYDSKGRVTTIQKEHDRPISILWNNDLNKPVGKVVNSTVDKVAYFDGAFSVGGVMGHGWVTSIRQTVTIDSKIGEAAYQLSPFDLWLDMPQSGDYIISFWYKSGNINISLVDDFDNVISQIGQTSSSNTWQYYETSVQLGNDRFIRFSGSQSSVLIDEIRVYPKDALNCSY